jgi:hypothetical protein
VSATPPAPDTSMAADAWRATMDGLIRSVDAPGLHALLARRPAEPLLEAMRDAMDVLAPTATPRLIDRILGRDLVRRAHPDAPDVRLRLLLERCREAAEARAGYREDVDAAGRGLRAKAARLGDLLAAAAPDAPGLRAVQATQQGWMLTAAQLELVCASATHLLERHRELRDVLVPLWHQHRAAQAARSQLTDPGLGRIARLRDELDHLAVRGDTPIPNTPSEEAPP